MVSQFIFIFVDLSLSLFFFCHWKAWLLFLSIIVHFSLSLWPLCMEMKTIIQIVDLSVITASNSSGWISFTNLLFLQHGASPCIDLEPPSFHLGYSFLKMVFILPFPFFFFTILHICFGSFLKLLISRPNFLYFSNKPYLMVKLLINYFPTHPLIERSFWKSSP